MVALNMLIIDLMNDKAVVEPPTSINFINHESYLKKISALHFLYKIYKQLSILLCQPENTAECFSNFLHV